MSTVLCFRSSDVEHAFEYFSRGVRYVKTHAGKLIVLNSEPFLRDIHDIGDTFIQLKVHITIVNKKTGEYLTFRRQPDNIKHQHCFKKSIGITTSVYRLPDEGQSIHQLISAQVLNKLHQTLNDSIQNDVATVIEKKLRMDNFRLLYAFDDRGPIVGLLVCLSIDPELVVVNANNYEWESVTKLTGKHKHDFYLDSWAKLVLGTKSN